MNFSASQTIGLPNRLSLQDTSTGVDAAVVKRRVYLYKVDQSTIVPSGTTTAYIDWPNFPSSTTIAIDALDKDYCLIITCQWLDVSNNVLYTKTSLPTLCTMYGDTFAYGLVQAQASNPALITNKNYFTSAEQLRVYLDQATQAASFGVTGDQFSAQAALDDATTLITNANNFQ